MELAELSPSLHLVRPAFGQIYVWQDGSKLGTVDTSVPGTEDDLADAFAQLGHRCSGLRRVVVTHGHADYAGSAAAVHMSGDVEVLVDRDDAAVVRGERQTAGPELGAAERSLWDRVQPPPRTFRPEPSRPRWSMALSSTSMRTRTWLLRPGIQTAASRLGFWRIACC